MCFHEKTHLARGVVTVGIGPRCKDNLKNVQRQKKVHKDRKGTFNKAEGRAQGSRVVGYINSGFYSPWKAMFTDHDRGGRVGEND